MSRDYFGLIRVFWRRLFFYRVQYVVVYDFLDVIFLKLFKSSQVFLDVIEAHRLKLVLELCVLSVIVLRLVDDLRSLAQNLGRNIHIRVELRRLIDSHVYVFLLTWRNKLVLRLIQVALGLSVVHCLGLVTLILR